MAALPTAAFLTGVGITLRVWAMTTCHPGDIHQHEVANPNSHAI